MSINTCVFKDFDNVGKDRVLLIGKYDAYSSIQNVIHDVYIIIVTLFWDKHLGDSCLSVLLKYLSGNTLFYYISKY